jgi:hypothetical protein
MVAANLRYRIEAQIALDKWQAALLLGVIPLMNALPTSYLAEFCQNYYRVDAAEGGRISIPY